MERRPSKKEKRKRNKGFPYKKTRKDKKAQVFFFTFMLGVTIIILALAFAPGLTSHIQDMRSPDDLDCGNSSISSFDQATCVVTDISGFYIIGGLIAIAGAVIGARLILR